MTHSNSGSVLANSPLEEDDIIGLEALSHSPDQAETHHYKLQLHAKAWYLSWAGVMSFNKQD